MSDHPDRRHRRPQRSSSSSDPYAQGQIHFDDYGDVRSGESPYGHSSYGHGDTSYTTSYSTPSYQPQESPSYTQSNTQYRSEQYAGGESVPYINGSSSRSRGSTRHRQGQNGYREREEPRSTSSRSYSTTEQYGSVDYTSGTRTAQASTRTTHDRESVRDQDEGHDDPRGSYRNTSYRHDDSDLAGVGGGFEESSAYHNRSDTLSMSSLSSTPGSTTWHSSSGRRSDDGYGDPARDAASYQYQPSQTGGGNSSANDRSLATGAYYSSSSRHPTSSRGVTESSSYSHRDPLDSGMQDLSVGSHRSREEREQQYHGSETSTIVPGGSRSSGSRHASNTSASRTSHSSRSSAPSSSSSGTSRRHRPSTHSGSTRSRPRTVDDPGTIPETDEDPVYYWENNPRDNYDDTHGGSSSSQYPRASYSGYTVDSSQSYQRR